MEVNSLNSVKHFCQIDKDSNDIVSVIQKAMDTVREYYQNHGYRKNFLNTNW